MCVCVCGGSFPGQLSLNTLQASLKQETEWEVSNFPIVISMVLNLSCLGITQNVVTVSPNISHGHQGPTCNFSKPWYVIGIPCGADAQSHFIQLPG